MLDNKNEMETSQTGWTIGDTLKILSALAVTIPLFLGYFQYQRTVQQDIDKNFNNLVEQLSSDKKENRLAGATNLGTIILKGGEYYNAAIDILINYVAIENDINVLNAIRGSLEKVNVQDYKRVIQQLLDLERNSFIYAHPLRTSQKTDELKKLQEQQVLVINFIALMLDKSRDNPTEDLLFYQNSLNDLVLKDMNLLQSTIENSAFSLSVITNTNFSDSKIINTVFTFSTLSNCNFSNCQINASLFDQISWLKNTNFNGSTFKDVFFAGSDLTGADFTGVKGLEPMYFYKATNVDKAKFDSEFKAKLGTLYNITLDEYLDYLDNSTLTAQRLAEINKTIKELNVTVDDISFFEN